MSAIIAVHCGAGTHCNSLYLKYKKLSKKACLKAVELLRNEGNALDAVKVAIKVLEDDPLTNCGFGSNLTDEGKVENDASIMDGKTLLFGACGAVTSIKNPIELAHNICLKQREELDFGLVPPMLLVGKGAVKYAKSSKLKIVKNSTLISSKALKQYKKYSKLVMKEKLFDTVGAVCLDNFGNVAAGCSSGGILLKKPGRLGQAAIYASGVWADSSIDSEPSVAVCTTGCGEYLIRTQLAKVIGDKIKTSDCPTLGVSEVITKHFLESKFLSEGNSKLCGALVLHFDNKSGDLAILWGHTTETMSIGYMKCSDDRPKSLMSELPPDVSVGTKVNVSGFYTYSSKV